MRYRVRQKSCYRKRFTSLFPLKRFLHFSLKLSLTSIVNVIIPLILSPLLIGCWAGSLHDHRTNGKEVDLTSLSIEELMEIEFVTLFKKPGRIFESAAAAYAISKDDIEQTGVASLPEALRMVPGMQVAQHNASSYAVTIRGFSGLSRGISGQFANKLLVMNDGRSIYTPLFSGVVWEAQDVLLDDVERIEVIRGPGASLWGANAVNGIINIISQNAEDTQGTLLTFGGGTELQTFGHLRYGGHIGETSFFRIYGKYLKSDGFVDSSGTNTNDDWHVLRGGFRFDTFPTTDNMVTLQGEIYDGKYDRTYDIVRAPEPPFLSRFDFDNENSGGNILGRWRHSFSSESEFSLQVYFDRIKFDEAVVRGAINTYDLDFYHRFHLGQRHDVVWGTGYRLISDNFDSTFTFSLNPRKRKLDIYNAFIQDDIQLVRDRVKLTLGSKLEHNEYTGFEIQPTGRLFWQPGEEHALWASASRAIRSPSRGERDARMVIWSSQTTSPTTFFVLNGRSDFKSESMWAFETGYRFRPSSRLAFDSALFYNDYDNLRSDEVSLPFVTVNSNYPPHFELELNVSNNLRGHSYGFEFSTDYQPSNKLKLRGSYSYLKIDLTSKARSDLVNETIERQSPKHQFYLQSFYQIRPKLNLNLFFRFVDELPVQNIGSYASLNGNLSWQVSKNLKLSVIGQNLLTKDHAETSQFLDPENVTVPTGTEATRVQRGVYSKITVSF